jgi:hypothetical protein
MAKGKTMAARQKKRKKIRYRKVEFKVSDQQKKRIDRYCRYKKLTPVKMIKKAVEEYLQRHAADLPEQVVVSKNQLKLFDLGEEKKAGVQTALFSS